MLGIFDSGLGGLTVVRALRERLPECDIVYLGDSAHVPYGDRAPEELLEFLRHNIAYLNEAGAQAIVVACNTSCAIAAKLGWPQSAAPIVNLIESAADAVAELDAQKIGVLATTVTARSGAYGNAIRTRIPGVSVEELAAPALVPLVEAGHVHGRIVRSAVSEACEGLSGDIDTLVYGCTHYPVLDAHFEAVLGPEIVRLDPAIAQAEATARLVAEVGIPGGAGTVRYATTGDPKEFSASVRALLGEEEPEVISAAEILTRIGNA